MANLPATRPLTTRTLSTSAKAPIVRRVLCDLPSQEGHPALVATGGSGAIVTWTDTRNGKDADIYAMQVLEVGTVDVPGPAADEFTFFGPSRNPAHGSLTLRFALPRQARVQLTIYDVAGRRVRELASGARPAGEQAIAWDLRDERGYEVSAGLYFAVSRRKDVRSRGSSRRCSS